MSTSGKRLLTHFVCAEWESVGKHVRHYPQPSHSSFISFSHSFSFNFHSILLQLLLSISIQLEIKPCIRSAGFFLCFRSGKIERKIKTYMRKIEMLTNNLCITEYVKQIYCESLILTVNFIFCCHFFSFFGVLGIDFHRWKQIVFLTFFRDFVKFKTRILSFWWIKKV